MKPLNLDANATYGLLADVENFLRQGGLMFQNPSSIHHGGQAARIEVEIARDHVRSLLGLARDGSVVFTSGATESNNAAIMSTFWPYLSAADRKSSITPSLVLSTIEHPSSIECSNRLGEMGVDVRRIGPSSNGEFMAHDFAQRVDEYTKLVSIIYVQNETGQVLPVRQISEAVKKKNPRTLVHVDAVQALGKLPVSPEALGADFLSISGHKIGALAGTGALILRDGIGLDPLVAGGPQELRRRAGTENVVGIRSFGKACEIALSEHEARRASMIKYRDALYSALATIDEVRFNFSHLPQVGNTISLRVSGISTGDLVVALDLADVWVSSGSACSSGKVLASPTLIAMGMRPEEAAESIRLSVRHDYDEADFFAGVERLCVTIKRMVRR